MTRDLSEGYIDKKAQYSVEGYIANWKALRRIQERERKTIWEVKK